MDHDTKMRIHSSLQTEQGNAAARLFELPEGFTSVKDSIDGLVAKVCVNVIFVLTLMTANPMVLCSSTQLHERRRQVSS